MLTRHPHTAGADPRTTVSFILLTALLVICWLGGGASRADAAGQTLVRSAAWLVLIAALFVCPWPTLRPVRAVALLILASLLLVVLQLVPLPPALWQALPGRAIFAEAAAASGQSQPWRPWSITPAATINAASSLVVPATVLMLAAGLNGRARAALPMVMLLLVSAGMLLGLLQAAGAGFDNPFINEAHGEVAGPFANRNHFALFLALGSLVAPVWAFGRNQPAGWRAPLSLGLVLLFSLTILASGSRAGMVLGVLAVGLGLALAWDGIRRMLHRAPRWATPALLFAVTSVLIIFVAISVMTGRAESISRVLSLDVSDDMRRRGFPVVMEMVRSYFPIGSGFGSFDPLFRMHEPLNLLKLTYFNHAHNDFLEIVLDGGLPGLLLLAAGVGWWGWASYRAWHRSLTGTLPLLPRLGSAMILLILLASAFDYPARTPLMMAMLTIAGVWLSSGRRADGEEVGNG